MVSKRKLNFSFACSKLEISFPKFIPSNNGAQQQLTKDKQENIPRIKTKDKQANM
jgi:hypothetical protein